MTGPAQLSCRSGVARSGASRSGALLSGTATEEAWHEAGTQRANPWTLADPPRVGGDADDTNNAWTLDS